MQRHATQAMVRVMIQEPARTEASFATFRKSVTAGPILVVCLVAPTRESLVLGLALIRTMRFSAMPMENVSKGAATESVNEDSARIVKLVHGIVESTAEINAAVLHREGLDVPEIATSLGSSASTSRPGPALTSY